MTLADLSIKRPIFITCIVSLMIVLGYMSLKRMPVDLFPDVTFPIIIVNTPYPGASPNEVENMISKPLEEQMSTLSGIKTLRSTNYEGLSTVVCEFTLETDIKYAEQQVRDKVSLAKRKLPTEALDSTVRRIDPADQPIMILSFTADQLSDAKKFDVVSDIIKPKIEQISQVGLVEILGARKREIHVELDRNKLKTYEVSASMVTSRIAAAGQNIPVGKVNVQDKEIVYRTVGEFKNLKDISSTIVNFWNNDVPITVDKLGEVKDSLEDEKSRSFVNGSRSVILMVFRQTNANTIGVVDAINDRLAKINADLKTYYPGAKIEAVRDSSKMIRANVDDVKESIVIGIVLTIIVVFFFLGSVRSTIITGLALPNSLIGAFLLMSMNNFSINIMSLLALSLAVGLLVDDAIVVRENIFRHIEMGKNAIKAALEGSKEVTLAVIATTLCVIAVFGPIGFLKGVVGQFFKQFGLTVCFALAISLFDALTIAPMMSAYFAGKVHKEKDDGPLWRYTFGYLLKIFDKFQEFLENTYERIIKISLKHSFLVLLSAVGIFVFSLYMTKYVPKTFLPASDAGEFMVSLELKPGDNLEAMDQVSQKVDSLVRKNSAVHHTILFVGGRNGESNMSSMYVILQPSKQRTKTTTEVKEELRAELKQYAFANPIVKDIDNVGGGQRPFNVNIIGSDLDKLEEISLNLFARLKKHPGLKDIEISHRPGRPEFQVEIDNLLAQKMGIGPVAVGAELRNLVEGTTPAVYREAGDDYDIRVRLKEEQRNLKDNFESLYVPNINNTLVKLSNVGKSKLATGPTTINRQDRGRYIQISGDVDPKGPGMAAIMSDIKDILEKETPLPPGFRYAFVGQAESFKELIEGIIVATILGVLFIYLVLASLYESFVIPFTIMLVLPLAACGAFYALFLAQSTLDIFSMIGCVMLLGIATKNSILLVDYTHQLMEEGLSRHDAIIKAGKTRLRPILMTTFALVSGMLPVAIGLNEASKQRTSMGIAVIGGLVSSTLLTLVVIPAAFSYIDRFREWSLKIAKKVNA